MKSSRLANVFFFLVAPPVLALAGLGLWLAFEGSVENYKFGRISEQIILTVVRAREMRVPVKADPTRMQSELIKRLVSFDGMSAIEEAARLPRPNAEPEKKLLNPWGQPLEIVIYPSAQAIRFETALSSATCRKVLNFYATDAVSLGLLRVDVKEPVPSSLWRLIYQQPAKVEKKGIEPLAIKTGCGRASRVLVSLTFSLK